MSSSTRSVRSGRLSPICRADNFWIAPEFDARPECRASANLHRPGDDDYIFRYMPGHRSRISVSLHCEPRHVRSPDPRADRSGDRPSERDAVSASLRRTRTRRALCFDDTSLVRLGQILRLRPRRGRRRPSSSVSSTLLPGPTAFMPISLFGAGRTRSQDAIRSGKAVSWPMWLSILGPPDTGRPTMWRASSFSEPELLLYDPWTLLSGRLQPQPLRGRRHAPSFRSFLPISAGPTYARYEAQPEPSASRLPPRGHAWPRGRWIFTAELVLTGSVLLDLDRYLLARDTCITRTPSTPGHRRLPQSDARPM